jgi:hypothetical protein
MAAEFKVPGFKFQVVDQRVQALQNRER